MKTLYFAPQIAAGIIALSVVGCAKDAPRAARHAARPVATASSEAVTPDSVSSPEVGAPPAPAVVVDPAAMNDPATLEANAASVQASAEAAPEPTATATVAPSEINGRISAANLIRAFREIQLHNFHRAANWHQTSDSDEFAEGTCNYLSSTVAGTWLIEATLRDKLIRSQRLFLVVSENGTEATSAHREVQPELLTAVQSVCSEGIPVTPENASEISYPASLAEELPLDSNGRWTELTRVDREASHPGLAAYFGALRQLNQEYCSAHSVHYRSRARLEALWTPIDSRWNEAQSMLSELDASPVQLRASELLFAAGGIAAELNDESLSDTDRLFKMRGISDVLARASFSRIGLVVAGVRPEDETVPRYALEISRDGPLASELPDTSWRFRDRYAHFANYLMGASPNSGVANYDVSSNDDSRVVINLQEALPEYRTAVCDRYPLEFNGYSYCRQLHLRRCGAATVQAALD